MRIRLLRRIADPRKAWATIAAAVAVVAGLSLPSARADEQIFYLDTRKPGLFGEIYHVALGLGTAPQTYVYLPYFSGVEDPQERIRKLQERAQAAQVSYARASQAFDLLVARSARELQAAAERRKEPSRSLARRRAALRTLLESGQAQKLGLPSELERQLSDAFVLWSRRRDEHRRANSNAVAARTSLAFASFLQSMGLGDRIIPYELPDKDLPTRKETFGSRVKKLVGRKMAGAGLKQSGFFAKPTWKALGAATWRFLDAAKRDPDATVARAESLFRQVSDRVRPEVRDYAFRVIGSRIPEGHAGVIIWNRQRDYHAKRNLTEEVFLELAQEAMRHGLVPIVFGPPLSKDWTRAQALLNEGKLVDATSHWSAPEFADPKTSIARQLSLFRFLSDSKQVVAQAGMLGGALDGVRLATGLPTVVLVTDTPTTQPGEANSLAGRIRQFGELLGKYHLEQLNKDPEGRGALSDCVRARLQEILQESAD